MLEDAPPVIKIQTAWLWWIMGYLFIAIAPFIFPPISDAMGSTTWGGILETVVIILEILFILLIPLIKISSVLLTPVTSNNPLNETTYSIVILIFGLLITYFGYFMITSNGGDGGLVSVLTGGLEIALFWISLIITWLATVIIAPVNTIIKVNQ